MGLSFTVAAGPRQRSDSHVRVPWDLWSHITFSDSRLPQSAGPGSRIYIPEEPGGPLISPGTHFLFVTSYEVSNPPPHGFYLLYWLDCPNYLPHNHFARTEEKIPFPTILCFIDVFTNPFPRIGLHNPFVLLLRAWMFRALPGNGRCLQSYYLTTGLYATVLIRL
jgi:hypothetical protein